MSRPRIAANQISVGSSNVGNVLANVAGVAAWTNAGSKIDAIPSGAGQIITRTFVSDGDTNGVIFFIGSGFGADPYSNPAVSGQIVSVFSATSSGGPTTLFDRLPNTNHTTDSANSWMFLDLGANRSLVTSRYQLRNSGTSNLSIRNWKLQATNSVASTSVTDINNATWTDIDIRVSDTTMGTGADVWASYVPSQPGVTSYRYFRILQTGLNAGGTNRLCLGEWEMYGTLTYAADAVVDGRIVQTSGTTGTSVRQSRWSSVLGTLSCTVAPTITTTETNGSVTISPNGTGVVSLSRMAQAASTPASATATGVAGQIVWDANFIYVCTATNTWKRVAIATW